MAIKKDVRDSNAWDHVDPYADRVWEHKDSDRKVGGG